MVCLYHSLLRWPELQVEAQDIDNGKMFTSFPPKKKDSYEKVCNETLLLFVSIDSFDHFSLFVFFIFFFIETTIISLFAC